MSWTHLFRIRTTLTRMAWRSMSQLKEDSANLDYLQVSAGREPDSFGIGSLKTPNGH